MKHPSSLAVAVDQALYSLSTFASTLIVAHALSPKEFGYFALGLALTVATIGFHRVVACEPVLIWSTSESEPNTTIVSSIRQVTRLTALLGGLLAALFVLTLIVLGRGWHIALMAPFLTVPFIYNFVRYCLLSAANTSALVLADTLTVTAQVGSLVALTIAKTAEFGVYLTVWSAIPLLTLAIAPKLAWQVSRAVSSRRSQDVQRSATTRRQFGIEYLIGIAASQGALWMASFVAGPVAATALRGADAMIGPFRIVLQALPAVYLNRWGKLRRKSLYASLIKVAAPLCMLLILIIVATRYAPDRIGTLILGDSWLVVRPILPLVVAAQIPITITTLCSIALKSHGASGTLLRARLIVAPAGLILGISGAVLGAAHGAAVGALITSVLAAILWSLLLRSVINSRSQGDRDA